MNGRRWQVACFAVAFLGACAGIDVGTEGSPQAPSTTSNPTGSTSTSPSTTSTPTPSPSAIAAASPSCVPDPAASGSCTCDSECPGGKVCEGCGVTASGVETPRECVVGCHTDGQCPWPLECHQLVECSRCPCPWQCG